jgi:hypothetical protein
VERVAARADGEAAEAAVAEAAVGTT